MRQEYEDLGRSPSKKHVYFPGTLEHKEAIAREAKEKGAKVAARTFRVSVCQRHTEYY